MSDLGCCPGNTVGCKKNVALLSRGIVNGSQVPRGAPR